MPSCIIYNICRKMFFEKGTSIFPDFLKINGASVFIDFIKHAKYLSDHSISPEDIVFTDRHTNIKLKIVDLCSVMTNV